MIRKLLSYLIPSQDLPRQYLLGARRRQAEAYRDAQQVSLVGNMLVALVVTWIGWKASSPAISVVLVLGQMFLTIYSCIINARITETVLDDTAYARAIRLMLLGAVGVALLWGIYLLHVAPRLPDTSFLMLAIIAVGITGAGAQNLSHIPQVSVTFTITFVAVLAAMMWLRIDTHRGVVIFVLGVYVSILLHAIAVSYRSFLMRVRSEIETERNNEELQRKNLQLVEARETVNLLLHDFENFSADWLWECDLEGRIVNPSARFCEAAGLNFAEMAGRNLGELFDPGDNRDEMLHMLLNQQPFNTLVLGMQRLENRHWWEISAHPRKDPQTGVLTGMRGFASDVTIVKQAELHVAQLAHYDSLTGLPNRATFHRDFAALLATDDSAIAGALLCLDLDGFKRVNDSLGHPIGDELLKTVALRLQEQLSDGDWMARLGGDEFMVVLPRCTHPEYPEEVARRLIVAIAQPMQLRGFEVICSTSIGIVNFVTGSATIDDLVRHADLALYEAKASGRNCYRKFSSHLLDGVNERRELETDLRHAVTSGQLEMHYQPITDLGTGAIIAYEALMRWDHPVFGAIPPDLFIPIAEDSGLIISLGEWALREVTRQAASWPEDLSVTINISPVQLHDGALLGTIVNALATAALNPRRLIVEITETVLLVVNAENLKMLQKMADLGLRIALDDFGTGYSSLNYLRTYPFNKIKIDRSFVSEVADSAEARSIIAAIIDLARGLGMTTVAEGIETEAQLKVLRELGCDEGQGFLFSAPHAASQMGSQGSQPAPRSATGIKRLAINQAESKTRRTVRRG